MTVPCTEETAVPARSHTGAAHWAASLPWRGFVISEVLSVPRSELQAFRIYLSQRPVLSPRAEMAHWAPPFFGEPVGVYFSSAESVLCLPRENAHRPNSCL